MELELVQDIIGQAPQVAHHGTLVPSVILSTMPSTDNAVPCTPWLMPVTYHAVDINEPTGKARFDCRKVRLQLTVMGAGDAVLRVTEGLVALNRVRAKRLTYEAAEQGGVLSQQDLAFLLGTSLESIADILAFFDGQDKALP